MLISELITELEALQKDFGDAELFYETDDTGSYTAADLYWRNIGHEMIMVCWV